MNTRQHRQQKVVQELISESEKYRAKNQMMWDEPVCATGARTKILDSGDWFFLNLNHIYPEVKADV